MTKYKLSIIIPHFNCPKSLEGLLDSIGNRRDIQTIIVDDNSTKYIDEYERVKKSRQSKNIIFLTNDAKSKGAGACRNIALKKAQSEWVIFADADDYLLRGYYEVISPFFTSNNDIIFFSPTSTNILTGEKADRHVQYQKILDNYKKTKTKESELNLRYRFFVPWSKMINKNFLDRNKINFEEVIVGNDVMFSALVGFHMKMFEVSNEKIYCVTQGKGTLTTTVSEKLFDVRLDGFIRYVNFLKKHLDYKDFRLMNVNGKQKIMDAINYGFGFSKVFKIYLTLKKNKISIFGFRWSYINPYFVISRIIMYRQEFNKKKKFIERK